MASSNRVRLMAAPSCNCFHLSIRFLMREPISSCASWPRLTRSWPFPQTPSQRGHRPCISASRACKLFIDFCLFVCFSLGVGGGGGGGRDCSVVLNKRCKDWEQILKKMKKTWQLNPSDKQIVRQTKCDIKH